MKTEKDKLIDFMNWYHSPENHQNDLTITEIIDMYLSINPQNETDGHRRLEDNKDKESICPLCGYTTRYNHMYELFECLNSNCLWSGQI